MRMERQSHRRRHRRRVCLRTVLGTATFATTEEVTEVYRSIINGVASIEHVQLVVMGEHFFSREQRRENPNMEAIVRRVHREMKALADERRSSWANVERAFQASGKRDEMSHSDGVHNTPAGHEVIAEMLVGVIAAAEAPRTRTA